MGRTVGQTVRDDGAVAGRVNDAACRRVDARFFLKSTSPPRPENDSGYPPRKSGELNLPRREASIMRRYFRGALALAAVGLLCSTGARANTLTQNSSWTVDRSGTCTKYRVVAYGDSIYAGYNGSVTSAAIFAAPTVQ